MKKKKSLLKILFLFLVFFGILGMKNYCKAESYEITKHMIAQAMLKADDDIKSVVWEDNTTEIPKSVPKSSSEGIFKAKEIKYKTHILFWEGEGTATNVAFKIPAETPTNTSSASSQSQTQTPKFTSPGPDSTYIASYSAGKRTFGVTVSNGSAYNINGSCDNDSKIHVSVVASGLGTANVTVFFNGCEPGTKKIKLTCGSAYLFVYIQINDDRPKQAKPEISVQSTARIALGTEATFPVTVVNPLPGFAPRADTANLNVVEFVKFTGANGNYSYVFRGKSVGTTTITFSIGNAERKTLTITVYQPRK